MSEAPLILNSLLIQVYGHYREVRKIYFYPLQALFDTPKVQLTSDKMVQLNY